MAKLRHSHSKNCMGLSAFEEVAKGELAREENPVDSPNEVVDEADDGWVEIDVDQAECGRYGHWEGVMEEYNSENGRIVRDASGAIIWYAKEYKGVCAKCGSRRRV